MSRRTGFGNAHAFMGAIALVVAPAASGAQDSPPPVNAEQAMERAREVYGPPDTRARPECPPPKPGDEIVVCGQTEDMSKYRVQSSGDLDPAGAGATDTIPRAPEVGTAYPGVVVASGCFIPPCPPPMPVLIDLKAIPEAPPGSDADRVAKGLAPRGDTRDAGVTPPG
ncbi:hypothetical protein GRI40_08185 [Altererythrobacter aerius]|uniref:Uncharacterized protein n=1 Tax=Tsuneonella aeria TaxID=1837929 RepID=A0A6I4TDR2_9SPHN|nr:hypothetical protein [Tsuneonella aeria]MXO75193.1 hypothetical protein [Tsuneonella aeria]